MTARRDHAPPPPGRGRANRARRGTQARDARGGAIGHNLNRYRIFVKIARLVRRRSLVKKSRSSKPSPSGSP